MKSGFLKLLFIGTLALSLSPTPLCAQPPEPDPKPFPFPSPDTPEVPIRHFIENFNWDRLYQAVDLILGAEEKPIKEDSKEALAQYAALMAKRSALAEIIHEINFSRSELKWDCGKPTFQINGNDAVATIPLSFQASLFNPVTHTEKLTLRRNPAQGENLKGWQIVPGNPETILSDPESGYLLRLATYLAYPQVMLEKIRADRSLKNMRQLTNGLSGAFQDDDTLSLRKDNWKQAVRPFLESEQVFRSRTYGKDLSSYSNYSFNSNLEGLTQARWGQIVEAAGGKPSNLIVIYEGANEQLSFNHDNRAAVSFIDGRVELIDRERAKSLQWKP